MPQLAGDPHDQTVSESDGRSTLEIAEGCAYDICVLKDQSVMFEEHCEGGRDAFGNSCCRQRQGPRLCPQWSRRRDRYPHRKFRLENDSIASRRVDSPASFSVRLRTSPATTWMTSPSRSSTPLMISSRPCRSSARYRSSTAFQTMMLLLPVSSSSVTKTTPLAEPGRWRQVTMPATRTNRFGLQSSRSAAVRQPRKAGSVRSNDIGWGPRVSPR